MLVVGSVSGWEFKRSLLGFCKLSRDSARV